MKTPFQKPCKADKNHCLRLRCFSFVYSIPLYLPCNFLLPYISTQPDVFKTEVKLICNLFNPCLSGLRCTSPVQQTACWAHLLQVSVLPPGAQALYDRAHCQKRTTPLGKQMLSWTKVCFAKPVKEEMQKCHKTCTPPAKGDAMEHMQDKT